MPSDHEQRLEAERALVRRYHANAAQAAELQAAAQAQALKDAKEGKLRDPAGTARNASVAGAVNIDKALVLEGRPTVIEQHVNVVDLVTQLSQRLGFTTELENRAAIESTAEES